VSTPAPSPADDDHGGPRGRPRPLRSVAQGDALVESYRRLADVFHDVLSEQSLDALLERIADTVGELIPHDDLAIYEADEPRRELRAVFARGQWADEVLADAPFQFGEGITGWAVEHREPLLANRADLDPRVRFVQNTPMEPESLIAVPLISRGRLQGTLNIYRVGLREFTEDEFHLAVRFGDAAALALDNARIRARLEHQARTDSLTGLFNHRAFHELVAEELLRASAARGTVALVMLDLDDFKRVNDVYGHAAGDAVLAEVAVHLQSAVRSTDVVCRIGGEEFAVVVPSADLAAARALAARMAGRLETAEFEHAGRITVSTGIAIGPDHAANPRELVACAEVAMMTAKARGKGEVVVFDDVPAERPRGARLEDGRSIAHLKLLQSLSAKLGRLTDVGEIGSAIATELKGLIDYHNCRVFLREGDDLRPIAFHGGLTATPASGLEVLATKVGVGITGRVAETGEPLLVGDAASCAFGHHIEGTATIEESLLAVPLRYRTQVVGVIVVSKLGLDQFDTDDLRLLEVLAGHASVALVNARLYAAQRREAECAKALLELARELSTVNDLQGVLDRVAEGAARILAAPTVSLWLPTAAVGELRCDACWSAEAGRAQELAGRTLRYDAAALPGGSRPFAVAPADYASAVTDTDFALRDDSYAVAPLPLDGRWGFVAVAAGPGRAGFDERELDLLDGIANQAKLAIANALSYRTLEKTFLSTVEALANALEAKDEETSSHTRWITDLALRVGRELGLDAQALKRVELGALFHDIGKIGIPASILAKPGPLTDDERRLIETHPELGERILAPIDQLELVRPIVRACHERFDGSGYPDGLEGEDIPLEARIIFACDAFHAMTSDRPYRNRLPLEEARRRLEDGAGSQLDPRVVEACLRVLAADGE
jgi:diguanylate cyclase (GGDEF)-like protein